ncbi:pre-mRNA-processing factor 39-2 isoform X2 [Lycium ferocissimum]|uniref:pre-mRNA-processing factor 39-2 isoform X2 n=1 Tax=Lycium ferocissimum TaxID=112874 RepID=UPI002814E1E1|nr:pre-mRNA-processing factor 39-2 isoform X2 [Lycium ferocissimum]
MELHNHNAPDGPHLVQVHNERLKDMISGGSEDLDSWNSLISEIEKTYPDDRNTICLAFDSFLSKFPLCHWNWKRYAYHEARLCNAEKAVEIFERAVESTPFSVGLWVDYCTFAMSSFEDPFDIRRLFTKGISLVGKDYFCHVLWDKYMSFEFSQEKWGSLALVYVQALCFPTKKLHKYYENFKKLVTNLEEEILHLSDDSRDVQLKELSSATAVLSNKEIVQVVKDLQDPSDDSVRLKALYKYRYCGDQLYQKACQLEEKIKSFESNIQRRYFQATPLDNDELKNWHDYLDFIEKQDDFDWALKLYERCLISCANYPEFWIRYVDFMETKGGRELSMFALERATKVFSKNVPEIHLFTARYMEQIGDPDGARASFPPINTDWDSCFIQYVTNRANMEKRLGNCSAASDIYKRAINMAVKEQKLQCIPMLYIGYYRLTHMITASLEVARDVIIDGIKRFPGCRLLYEFVDLCGSISEIRKAWSRHIKLFPQFIRTNTSSNHIGTEKSSLNSFTEQRRNISYVLVNQPSKGPSSDHMIQLSKGEQAQLLPLKDGKQPDQLSAEPSVAVVKGKDATGKQEQISPEVEDLSSGNGSGKNELSFDPLVQSKDDSSTPMELSHGPSQQRRDDLPGPMDFSYDSIPQPGEDVSKSPGPVLDFKEPSRPLSVLETSQERPSSEIINQVQDVELEQPPVPVSLENLSLISEEMESQDLVAMHSDDLKGGEEIRSSSTGIPPDPVNDGDGPASCSSPGPVTAGSSQQIYDTAAVPESGSSKVSNQPAGYDQQQQSQRADSQEPRLLDSQGDSQFQQVLDKAPVHSQSGTSQGNIPSNECWTLNNMPQQISMSGNHLQASSSPVSYSQPSPAHYSVHNSQQIGPNPHHEALNQTSQHISLSENHPQMSSPHASFSEPSTPQHSGQSSQQIGPSHHQEALNQTSQNYYQQQHLSHGQYQQHQLQMQQPYTSIQQQQMHPHPSQLLYQQQQLNLQQQQQQSQQQTLLLQQQQYFQQIQSLPYQQQQYLHQLQYSQQAQQLWQQQFQQQAQQTQPQEGQQMQQQLEQYRQSQELAYQMQQHGYQLLMHQYQVRQQGCQSMRQQQQQWQQQGNLQLQQYSHLQQQQYHHLEQQTDEEYNQTHQGEHVAVQYSSGTPAAESESPEIAKEPHSAEKFRRSVSPYRRPPTRGISPSHSTATLASEASSFSRTNSSRDQ